MGRKPKVLKARDIPSLAKYIKSDDCQNIILMLGAGVSTAAGIPDFRSPKTGLYSNLARLNLPHPEAVFEIDFFRRNPVPFYTLALELYPGKFRPTITHSFIRLLAEKDLLAKCFTQNIDTLERRAGVPSDKIIEAHGSFATQRCIDCGSPFDQEQMKKHILNEKIARCDRCKGLVKPDIVFFGESLPPDFIRSVPQMRKADLLIVMGTSLTVHPFASLAGMVEDSCPRVLVNLDRVGDFGRRSDDVVLLGKCDDIVKELCKELGWEQELMDLWHATAGTVEKELPGVPVTSEAETNKETAESKLKAEVDYLTATIEKRLALIDASEEEGPSALPSSSVAKESKDIATAEEPTQESESQGTTAEAHTHPSPQKL